MTITSPTTTRYANVDVSHYGDTDTYNRTYSDDGDNNDSSDRTDDDDDWDASVPPVRQDIPSVSSNDAAAAVAGRILPPMMACDTMEAMVIVPPSSSRAVAMKDVASRAATGVHQVGKECWMGIEMIANELAFACYPTHLADDSTIVEVDVMAQSATNILCHDGSTRSANSPAAIAVGFMPKFKKRPSAAATILKRADEEEARLQTLYDEVAKLQLMQKSRKQKKPKKGKKQKARRSGGPISLLEAVRTSTTPIVQDNDRLQLSLGVESFNTGDSRTNLFPVNNAGSRPDDTGTMASTTLAGLTGYTTTNHDHDDDHSDDHSSEVYMLVRQTQRSSAIQAANAAAIGEGVITRNGSTGSSITTMNYPATYDSYLSKHQQVFRPVQEDAMEALSKFADLKIMTSEHRLSVIDDPLSTHVQTRSYGADARGPNYVADRQNESRATTNNVDSHGSRIGRSNDVKERRRSLSSSSSSKRKKSKSPPRHHSRRGRSHVNGHKSARRGVLPSRQVSQSPTSNVIDSPTRIGSNRGYQGESIDSGAPAAQVPLLLTPTSRSTTNAAADQRGDAEEDARNSPSRRTTERVNKQPNVHDHQKGATLDRSSQSLWRNDNNHKNGRILSPTSTSVSNHHLFPTSDDAQHPLDAEELYLSTYHKTKKDRDIEEMKKILEMTSRRLSKLDP